jgi:predicted PurR-regulated permease PerM
MTEPPPAGTSTPAAAREGAGPGAREDAGRDERTGAVLAAGKPAAGKPAAGKPAARAEDGGGRKRGVPGEAALDEAEASAGATTVDDAVIEAGDELLDTSRSTTTGGKVSWLRAGFFGGLGLVFAYVLANAVWSVRAVLVRILIALFIAVSLDPAVRWLTRRGMRRGLAVMLILGVFVAIVTAFLWSVIPPLVRQFDQIIDDIPSYIQRLQRESVRFQELNERYDIAGRLGGLVTELPSRLGGGILGITGRVFGALANTVTVIVLTIYFSLDLPRLRRNVPRLAPAHRRTRVREITDLVIDKVGGYMIGQLTISTIAGVSAMIALSVLGAAAPLPLAIMVGTFALIPLIGATLGASIAVLITALTTGLWPTAVLLLVFFLLYQQLENYVIAPRVLRSAVDLSAAAVLLAGLIGATTLGLLGALMAIPTAAALKVIILQEMARSEQRAEAVERERVAARERLAAQRRPTAADDAATTEGQEPGGTATARSNPVGRLAALARKTRRQG